MKNRYLDFYYSWVLICAMPILLAGILLWLLQGWNLQLVNKTMATLCPIK